MAQQAIPLPYTATILYGYQFLSWLLDFPSGSSLMNNLKNLFLLGAGVMVQLATPLPTNASIAYGCQFTSQLLYFPTNSLLVAWESTG